MKEKAYGRKMKKRYRKEGEDKVQRVIKNIRKKGKAERSKKIKESIYNKEQNQIIEQDN